MDRIRESSAFLSRKGIVPGGLIVLPPTTWLRDSHHLAQGISSSCLATFQYRKLFFHTHSYPSLQEPTPAEPPPGSPIGLPFSKLHGQLYCLQLDPSLYRDNLCFLWIARKWCQIFALHPTLPSSFSTWCLTLLCFCDSFLFDLWQVISILQN